MARGQLETRLSTIVDQRSTVPDVQRFAAHLDREWAGLFSFLQDPTIDATNWRAEHAIRPAVVMRNVCGGNRTDHGARTQEILMSVFRTCRQRAVDPLRVMVDLLRERVPGIAAALFPP